MFCRARTCVYWCLLVCGTTNMSHTSSNSRALLVGFFKNAALALSVFSSVACLLSALSLLRPIGEPFKDRTAATWHVHCGPFKPPFPLRNALFVPPPTLHCVRSRSTIILSLSHGRGDSLFIWKIFARMCPFKSCCALSRSLARSLARSLLRPPVIAPRPREPSCAFFFCV